MPNERPAGIQSQPGGLEPRLIDAMMRPEFYPDHPAQIEAKQTHMSYVFLAGEYVYKIKKPVRFDFADCSTLAIRYELCREEVRLNQRLAPEVYLGVVPILGDDARFVLGEEGRDFNPHAREYAIRMRRLPDDQMLDRLVATGKADAAVVDVIAKKLAGFHRTASTAGGLRYGSATSIWRLVLGNLDESERFVSNTVTKSQFSVIEDYLKSFIGAHWQLLNNRVRAGRVREGHGDLKCEHVCLSDGIQIFDCLEFSERLRYGDVASDIAFLAMDLDALGAAHLADELIDCYAKVTGDEMVATLATFYKCHRACVRGKVESLKSIEDEVPSSQREQAHDRARASFSLAFRYALRGRPALVIVCGLVGTGKSTVSRRLSYRTGFEVLSSDRIRKRLAGLSETARAGGAYGAGIYSLSFDRLTYDTLLAEAHERLRDGCGVIIDATFKIPEDRRAALAVGARIGIPVLFVECQANEREILRRLHERTKKGDGVSDATAEVYLSQRTDFVPITEVRTGHHLLVDTGEDGERVLEWIEGSLRSLFQTGVGQVGKQLVSGGRNES